MKPMLSRRRFLTTSGLAATGLTGAQGLAARPLEASDAKPPAAKKDDDAHPPALVIRDASVFDSLAGRMLPPRTLVIAGGRIQSVGATDKPVEVPPARGRSTQRASTSSRA